MEFHLKKWVFFLKEFIAFGLFEYCFVINTKERKDFIQFFDRLILNVYSGNPNRKRNSDEEEKKKNTEDSKM